MLIIYNCAVYGTPKKRKEKIMPGYLLHLSACKPSALGNRSFVLGVEAPDILRKHYRVLGPEKAFEKYEALKVPGMPDYSVFSKRVAEKETTDSFDGLHYGVSKNPGIVEFWYHSLSDEDRKNPFYKGYVWHLLTDALMYKNLDIDSKFAKAARLYLKHSHDIGEFKESERNKLHLDWDKTNSRVQALYPEVILPDEIKELNVVKFEEGPLTYVDWPVLKDTIEYLRSFDPLEDDMDKTISAIMAKLGLF